MSQKTREISIKVNNGVSFPSSKFNLDWLEDYNVRRPSQVEGAIQLILVIGLFLTVLFLVSSYFLAMLLGPTLFFSTREGLTISNTFYYFPIHLFLAISFYIPVKLNAGQVFVFLLGVFSVCFVAAWRFRESFHEVVRKCLRRPAGSLFNNWLFVMPIITSMLFVAVITIERFQEAHGLPTGQPPLPENHFEAYLSLTYASVVEEVGFRVTTIGAFLAIYLFWVARKVALKMSWGRRLKLFFSALLCPDEAKRLVDVRTVSDFGLRSGVSIGEWIMVILTSSIFGLAHYLFGGGWDVGKITLASLVGLALGLTYLLYGVQAPILIHWFFNYYQYSYYLATEFYPIVTPVYALTFFITVYFGILGWLAVVILGIKRVVISRLGKESVPRGHMSAHNGC